MVWPSALTSNSDILKYVFEQGLTRLLQSGNDFSDLHQGVAEEIRIWLEANGVPDADNIMNSSDFKSAAIHLFASKVIRSYDAAKANEYSNKYIALMRSTRADLSQDPAASGTVGKIRVIRQGKDYFGRRRNDQIFGLDRG